MNELSFDLNDYIVAQLIANELGMTSKYNVHFIEYYLPADKTDEIEEVMQTGINYTQLEDGSLHFYNVNYT